MEKKKKLEQLAKEIEQCSICKKNASGKMVFGEGNPNAKIMFVGEAPGREEALNGRPFIGRSGKLLRQAIQDNGLQEDDVYITSPVKYLPNRGTPSIQEIEHAKTHFSQQVDIINPQIFILLGATAVRAVLGESLPITKVHGQIIERNGKKYLIMFHPAAGLRFPPLKKLFLEDFHKIASFK